MAVNVLDVIQSLSEAVQTAKGKQAVVQTALADASKSVDAAQAALDRVKADKWAIVEKAQADYDAARTVAEGLQAQVRELVGDLLPASDPRVRQG